jgi:hypothetical protein
MPSTIIKHHALRNLLFIIFSAAGFILNACGGGFAGDIEKAEGLLSEGDVTLVDEETTDETVDESEQFKTFAAKGRDLLAQYFDDSTGALLEATASEDVALRRKAMLIYAECLIGARDVNFFGLFSAFLGQESTGSEFAVFADLLPDDFDSEGYTDLQFAETVINTNTVAASLLKSQEASDEIEVDTEINYILTFLHLLGVSFVAKQFSENGEISAELAAAFVDDIDGTAQTLADAGLIDADIAATIQENSDTIAQGIAEGGDVETVVEELLAGNFD